VSKSAVALCSHGAVVKILSAASTVRGIATIRDRVTFRTVAPKTEGVKNSKKALWRKDFLRIT
jgi:hypothetical protein